MALQQPNLFDGAPDSSDESVNGVPTDDAPPPWPPQMRFPINDPKADRTVESVLTECFRASTQFTIVTAFTSLEYLTAFFSRHELGGRSVHVVLGNEPSASGTLYAQSRPIPERTRNYWLERGISVLHGAGVVRLIEAIDAGQVTFSTLGDLHAKLYVGEKGAVVGSSNFSFLGLRKQMEANVRFEAPSERYDELAAITDEIRRRATDQTDAIRDLLRHLLQAVRWEEALARAAAEILDGEWVSRYPNIFQLLQQQNLWPHQKQAVAQGLWILEQRGSVLIADATGSGKTRVGTHLLYGLLNQLWSRSQQHRTDAVVICPPQVTDNWSLEIDGAPASQVQAVSHGLLSQGNRIREMHRRVQRSNVLFLDEAHNFLSTAGGKRTAAIDKSAPDYVALLTATPINTGASDLLRMIELLGLDNLSEREFQTYCQLRRRPTLREGDEADLRAIVKQCTIRRTKHDLNRWVDRHEDGYTAPGGTVHRYPEHRCRTYATGETEADCRLAEEIHDLTRQMKGLLWLQSFEAKPVFMGRPDWKQKYVEQKVSGAAGLVSYSVRSALQSSRAALLEMIYGTEAAAQQVGLSFEDVKKTVSGNYVHAVEQLLEHPPSDRNPHGVNLPRWLTTGLRETVAREKDLAEAIGEKVEALSDRRMEARASKIEALVADSKDNVALVFGAKPLTLYHLQALLHERGVSQDVEVCDGGMAKGRQQKVVARLGLGAAADSSEETRGLIALCSDTMSEGLNLQRPDAVLLLDTPSVIRIAEQRVGRIDRMNSPHEAITVWWPDDSPPFQSQKRGLLIDRHNVTTRLIGKNIDHPFTEETPDALLEASEEAVGVKAMISDYEAHQETEDDPLGDAFQPIRELVGKDDRSRRLPLVDAATYDQIAGVEVPVMSRVAVRRSETPWGFFCLRGHEQRAPQWVLVSDEPGDGPMQILKPTVRTRLSTIADVLRERLPKTTGVEVESGTGLWDAVGEQLETMLGKVKANDRTLLSSKARHGIKLMDGVVRQYFWDAEAGTERRRVCKFLREALRPDSDVHVDLHDLASRWLGIVQPRYVAWRDAQKKLLGTMRREPVRLKDVKPHLIKEPIETEPLRILAEQVRREPPIERRIAAAILAIPE